MIPCICINDSNKPSQIPEDKWVKKGEPYHVVYTIWSITSQKIGVYLDEITFDESCLPYEYFAIDRFSFNIEDLQRLRELIRDCSDTDFSLEELVKQTDFSENLSNG